MPILQKKINEDFTIVHNAFIRDEKLGINARGLLLTMLSMKDGWNFSIKGLASILPDGEKKVSTALHSLEERGYLKRNRLTDKRGVVIEWEYMFSDEPIFRDIDTSSENGETDEKPHSCFGNVASESPHCRFGDVEKADVAFPDVEKRYDNKILNNQVLKNQILSDNSVNLSEKANSNPSVIDRQNDEQKKSMTYYEVLDEIGYDIRIVDFIPKSENDFREMDETDRRTDICQIPYSLKTDKKAMKEALKFLFAYSYYVPSMQAESKRLLDTVISTLVEMTAQDMLKIQGKTVKYHEIIDRLNDVIGDTEKSLFDWFISFEHKWKTILAENTIKHQKAYLKSCIWNWLSDYDFETDNDIRKLDYSFKNGGI